MILKPQLLFVNGAHGRTSYFFCFHPPIPKPLPDLSHLRGAFTTLSKTQTSHVTIITPGSYAFSRSSCNHKLFPGPRGSRIFHAVTRNAYRQSGKQQAGRRAPLMSTNYIGCFRLGFGMCLIFPCLCRAKHQNIYSISK